MFAARKSKLYDFLKHDWNSYFSRVLEVCACNMSNLKTHKTLNLKGCKVVVWVLTCAPLWTTYSHSTFATYALTIMHICAYLWYNKIKRKVRISRVTFRFYHRFSCQRNALFGWAINIISRCVVLRACSHNERLHLDGISRYALFIWISCCDIIKRNCYVLSDKEKKFSVSFMVREFSW